MTTETTLSRTERGFLAEILFLIVLLVGIDLINDSREGVTWPHLSLEMVVAIFAALGLALILKSSFRKSRELTVTRAMVVEREKEAARWRSESQKFIQGLSSAIDTQLVRWSLSPAEKEVALLLLKGLSVKEIADIRSTTEKTVRAQSVAIYSKSNLAGRSELAASFFGGYPPTSKAWLRLIRADLKDESLCRV